MKNVTVETNAKIRKISYTQRGIEILVVRHQEWIEPQPLFDQMNDIVGILSARDRNDAIVIIPSPGVVWFYQALKLLPSSSPIQLVFFFMDATTGADALLIQSQT